MTQNAEAGGGLMTLRAATVNSVNCAFARTELAVGFPKIIATAHAMGITQNTLKPVLTLTLGAIESTALEMATVASTSPRRDPPQPAVRQQDRQPRRSGRSSTPRRSRASR